VHYAAAVGPFGNAAGEAGYVDAVAAAYLAEDEALATARANAMDLGGTTPVLPEVGAALRFIASAVGARAVVEVGTGCGSSGIWLLRGMRPGGILTSVDTEPEYQRMARLAFTKAGFAGNQSRLILGRALEVLPRLSDAAYDIVFCDTNPRDYPDYLLAALRLLRPGGVVAFNEVLASPSPADSAAFPGSAFSGSAFPFSGDLKPAAPDAADEPDLPGMVLADERLVPMMLPIGAGLLAAVKRGG
jgi:predicted O-methyltransferase YrrM